MLARDTRVITTSIRDPLQHYKTIPMPLLSHPERPPETPWDPVRPREGSEILEELRMTSTKEVSGHNRHDPSSKQIWFYKEVHQVADI